MKVNICLIVYMEIRNSLITGFNVMLASVPLNISGTLNHFFSSQHKTPLIAVIYLFSI